MPFIKKITKIKNCKSWLNHEREIEFNKVNIVFGENGAGKSALSEIFQGGFDKKVVVNESKTITIFEPNQNTEVEILLKNKNTIKCTNKIWENQQNPDDLIIFDSNYIINNIHINGENAGHLPKIKQNQNKLLVSFSAEAGELKQEEVVANMVLKEFETKNKSILESECICDVKKHEDKMFNFYKNHTQQSIKKIIKERKDSKNTSTQKNLTNQQLLSKLTTISDLNILKFEINTVSLSSQKTFSSYFATELIKQSQEEAKIDFATDESFFQSAYKKIIDSKTKKCPVCDNIIAEDIITLYEKTFNEVYKKKKDEFEDSAKKLKEELEIINSEYVNFDQKIKEYKTNLLEINNETNNLFQKINDIEAYLIESKKEGDKKPIPKLISLIDEKQTKEIDFEINIYNQVKSIVNEINEKQKKLKLFIDDKISVLNKYKLENTNDNLKAKIEDSENLIKLCSNEIDFLKSDKIEREKQKISAKQEQEKLKERHEQARKNYADYLTGDLHTKQIERMQEILKDDFNVSFVLIPKQKVNTGLNLKDVNFDYEIKKGKKSLRLKDLSEGERQIIALAFFFAQIKDTSLKQDKILIFDDPVTSMDARNLKLLVDLIHKKTAEFSQVFIFTHHQLFYKYLTKTLDGNSYIVIKNKYEDKECSYLLPDNPSNLGKRIKKLINYCDTLQSSLNNSNLNYLDFTIEYGGMLRYSVETLIRDKILKSEETNFTEIIKNLDKIRIENEQMENLLKIYNYCNYSNTSHFDSEITSLDELKVQIEKFLEIYQTTTPSTP